MFRRIATTALLAGFLVRAATVFDPAADLALRENPSPVWQYGYSETSSLDPGQFRRDRHAVIVDRIGFRHPAMADQPGPGYYPYVAYNPTKQTQPGSSNGWALRAGEIAMEASNTGQYSLVRFVAPGAGLYAITARFAGIHFRLSSTDVHVLENAQSLFDAFIEGYGGDPGFHKVEGASPTAAYSGRVRLKAGDTITFACGYGKNKTHFNDTTGLFARVVLLKKGGGARRRGSRPDRTQGSG
jgi:hypothetical protein